MGKRTFTSDQIKELAKNKNVARCGDKSVKYTMNFKTEALKQYNEDGLSAIEIFQEAGFNLALIGKRAPNRLMNQWGTAFNSKNESGGQVKKKKGIMIKRIENRRETKVLKAKVVYLQAENNFLEKFRARKRE